MLRFRCSALPCVMSAALIAGLGCQPGGGQSSPPAGSDQASGDTPAGQVTVRIADRQVYEGVLAKHRGKPILVDFWSTWCVPCTEQFPHTVQLHAKYAASGLAVISVSLDEPSDEARVKTFLEKQGATFDNLLSKWEATTRPSRTSTSAPGQFHTTSYTTVTANSSKRLPWIPPPTNSLPRPTSNGACGSSCSWLRREALHRSWDAH